MSAVRKVTLPRQPRQGPVPQALLAFRRQRRSGVLAKAVTGRRPDDLSLLELAEAAEESVEEGIGELSRLIASGGRMSSV